MYTPEWLRVAGRYVKKILNLIMGAIPVALLVVILVIGVKNFRKETFWVATAYQLLTPLIAVCLTFYAAQMKSNEREAKRHAELILEKIQSIVMNEQFYEIIPSDRDISQDEVNRQIQMTNRKLSNCIESLLTYSERLHFKKDAEYIRTEFLNYRGLVDTYQGSPETLLGLWPALKKYSENIDSKCDKIISWLYK